MINIIILHQTSKKTIPVSTLFTTDIQIISTLSVKITDIVETILQVLKKKSFSRD